MWVYKTNSPAPSERRHQISPKASFCVSSDSLKASETEVLSPQDSEKMSVPCVPTADEKIVKSNDHKHVKIAKKRQNKLKDAQNET